MLERIKTSEFRKFIHPLVPDANELEVHFSINYACEIFCKNSWVWQEDLPPIDVVAYQSDYEIEVPSGVLLGHILSVYVGDDVYVPVGMGSNKSYSLKYDNKTIISLLNMPISNLDDGLKIRASVFQDSVSNECAKIIYDKYKDVIICGSLYVLFSLGNKSFTNYQLSEKYRNDFFKYIDSEKADILKFSGESNSHYYTQEVFI